jgi:hypothetical protein
MVSTVRTNRKVIVRVVVSVGLLAGAGAGALVVAAPWATHAPRTGLGPVGGMVVAITQAPTPVPVNPTSAGAVAGDVLASDPGTLPVGLRSYKLSDGRFAVLDPAAALPAVVVGDLAVSATAVLPATGTASSGPSARTTLAGALEKYDTNLLAQTGRSAVIVYATTGLASADSHDATTGWVFWGRDVAGGSYTSAPKTKDEAVSDAQAWIAKRDDPGAFQLIVTGTA